MSAMGKIGSDAQVTPPALGLYRSPDARGFIAGGFERPGLGVPRLIEGGVEAALTAVRRERPPLIVYDLSASNDPVGEVAALVSHTGRGTPLLCFSELDRVSADVGRMLRRAGVADFAALSSDERTDAVTDALRSCMTDPPVFTAQRRTCGTLITARTTFSLDLVVWREDIPLTASACG